jgi:hypothetical protein
MGRVKSQVVLGSVHRSVQEFRLARLDLEAVCGVAFKGHRGGRGEAGTNAGRRMAYGRIGGMERATRDFAQPCDLFWLICLVDAQFLLVKGYRGKANTLTATRKACTY